MPVRKIPRSHTSLIGYHAWAPGGHVAVESNLEMDFVSLMSIDIDVIGIEGQPVRIEFGNGRSYVPDFLVSFTNRNSRLVEIKPRQFLNRHAEKFAPKFSAATAYAAEQGWVFEIWTEEEIRTPRLENAKFLLPFRRETPDPGVSARILNSLVVSAPISINELIMSCWMDKGERSRGLAVLWTLISAGKIATDLDTELAMDSLVWVESGGHG